MAVKVVNLTRIRYFDTEKNKKKCPFEIRYPRKKTRVVPLPCRYVQAEGEKISRKKIFGSENDFERLVLN